MKPPNGAELVSVGRHGFLIGQFLLVVVAYGEVDEVEAGNEEVERVEVALDGAPGPVSGYIGPCPASERFHGGLCAHFSEANAAGAAEEGPDEVDRVEVGEASAPSPSSRSPYLLVDSKVLFPGSTCCAFGPLVTSLNMLPCAKSEESTLSLAP